MRTGTGAHFSAFASESARSLLFPLLSHAMNNDIRGRFNASLAGTYVVYNGRALGRGGFVASAVI